MGKSSSVADEAEIGLLKRIADNTPDMLYRMSLPDGTYEYVSSGAIDIFGHSPETFYKTPKLIAERIHPDWLDYFKTEWQKLLAGDMPPFYEYQIITKAGKTKWINQRNVLISDDDGKPVAIEGVVTDITTSKQNLKFENSTSKILKMIATGTPPSQIYNAIGLMYEERHPGMRCSMLELKGNELKHGGAPSLPKEYCEAVDGLVFGPNVGSCGTSTYSGKRVLVKDIATDPKWDKIKHLALPHGLRCCWSEPIKNSGGEVLGAFGMYYNQPTLPNEHQLADLESAALLTGIVMEREQRVAKLGRLSQAIEQAGEAIIITDATGIIDYVNPSFTSLTGYTADEALGANPRILKSDDQTDEYYQNLWQTISSGRIFNSSIIVKRKDNTKYPAIISIAPILDSHGEISHYVALQQDMTEHEMLEEQFRQSQKMEALGTLVGGIAHDFNNMLAGITGNLYLAKQFTKEQPQVLEKLTNAEHLSFRAADMIKQLLTFARKDRVNMKLFSLTSFIKEAIKLLRSSIPENISISQNTCANSLFVNGDTTQIYQILLNLVNNACDALIHHDDPQITINLSTIKANKSFIKKHPGIAPGNYAKLSVKDNGTGIPKQKRDHLFEPFFTTKEVGKGTGLGLAMVFGAVKNHHGHVEVESTQNKGSTFIVYLPIIDAESDVTPSQNNNAKTKFGTGETILLVDDQAEVVDTCKNVLESLGYLVLTVTNGQEATALYKEHADTIDLIVMDIIMPVMSGDKAAKLIRKINPDVKIIFATGYDKGAEVETTNEVVIRKPFAIERLSELIRETIDSK